MLTLVICVRNISDSVILALYSLKYFPIDILVHRHEKIPQYKIQVNYKVKAVYEYKMYLINTKQGKRITFSALKIALKRYLRK